jgi:hypothetical protein
MVARHPADREQALAWLAWDNGQALPRLARKLRHYGKYSYLAFIGEAAANVFKGQWPVTGSPLNVGISQWDNAKAPPWRATLAPRPALSEVLADRRQCFNSLSPCRTAELSGGNTSNPGKRDIAAKKM